MNAYGTGFPAVAARRGCQLPDPDGRAVAGPGATPHTLDTTEGVAAAVTSTAAGDGAGVTGPSPRRSDGSGYTLPVCCPVCDLPVDPAWAAATGSDRHGPCTTQPARMADAVRAHRAAHPVGHVRRAGHRVPARTSRPRPAAGPTTPSTRPSPTGPATAGPRAPRPGRSTTR